MTKKERERTKSLKETIKYQKSIIKDRDRHIRFLDTEDIRTRKLIHRVLKILEAYI